MPELIQGGLSNLCRLCGEDDRECFDLFDDERKEEELLFKIEQSVRIAITQGDGLPTGICALCHDKLTGYATFYQQCHDTQDKLQEFLSIECAMQKSTQCNQEQEVTNDDDDGHTYEGETEDVYYYEEAPDEDMETEEGEEGYAATEVHEDSAKQSSCATSERNKGPSKDLSQKEDSVQSRVEHLSVKKQCTTKNDLISTRVPLSKSIDKVSKLHSVAKTSSEEKTNQKQINIQLASSPVILEPPPLVKIVQITQKTGPPPASVLKQFPQTAPPLVPIANFTTQDKSSSKTANSLPTPFLVPITRTATQPILKSEAVKSKLASGAPCLVPISMLKPNSKDVVFSRSSKPKSEKLSTNVLPSKKLVKGPANPVHLQMMEAKTQSVVNSKPKVKGRAFIMTEDKTVAVEVDIVNENVKASSKDAMQLSSQPVSFLRLRNIDLVPSKDVESETTKVQSKITTKVQTKTAKSVKEKNESMREKCALKVNQEPVPYLKLKSGNLVPLDDVDKIPLDDIPVPPVILMCYSDSSNNLPEVCLKESVTFSESSTSASVQLCSGMFVNNYPAGLPPPVKVLPNPSTDVRKANVFVLKNSCSSQLYKKKKILAVRSQRNRRGRGCIIKSCPEVLTQVEVLPTVPPQFKCKVCDLTLASKKRCEYHLVTKHFAERCNFECRECGKKFATNFLRNQHVKLKHSRPSEYMCSMCGAKFRTLYVLKGHELRHTTSDPPFKCDACGKGFYTKTNCNKHFADVHTEKSAICDICGESFAGMGRLNEHHKKHLEGFKCSECEKAFNSKSRLRAHKQIHSTAEKQYLYCKCGKKFVTFAFLHNHSKVCEEAQATEEVPSTSSRRGSSSYYEGVDNEFDSFSETSN